MHRGGDLIMRPWTLFGVIALCGLVLDQASKLFIHRTMALFQTIPVIDGCFNIYYIRNPGAAFSFLSQASWRRPFFISVSLFASLVILFAFRKLRDDQKLAQISLAMIFSGAAGNLIDRVRLGEVIDFIQVYWRTYYWPAFNVADSFICVGVALLALDMFREERGNKHSG